VNWRHFRAFLWLRWRIRRNQMKRAGALSAVLFIIVAVAGVFISLGLFAGSIALGVYALGDVSPLTLLFIWDGMTVAFLFVWMISLVSDLQRSEVLSLDKFMHLPVSLTGAFLINYLSGLINLPMVIFVPPMVGLTIGLAISRGPALLLTLPVLAAFLLMVTALTNQFQGWLATLLTNKRRRRSVIMFVTFGFVLLAQLPNLFVQVMVSADARAKNALAGADGAQQAHLEEQLKAQQTLLEEQVKVLHDQRDGRITADQAREKHAEIAKKMEAIPKDLPARAQAQAEAKKGVDQQTMQQSEPMVRLFNLVLPPGWLPLSAAEAAAGTLWPALLGTLGLGLIGSASLWRSYRSTLRLYSGQLNARGPKAAVPPPEAAVRGEGDLFLERRLPGISEQAAAIALTSFRSLVRAPEAKIMLLSPILMAIIFGTMLARTSATAPPPVRVLMATGAMTAVLFGMLQVIGNQFGFDRNGFRVFVLCGARRRDILLGKNLAFAPLALGLSLLVTSVLQCFFPMPIDLFLSVIPQFISMFLLFCLLTNLLSILAPMSISPGTMRPVSPKAVPILLHIVFMMFLFPLTMSLTLLPLGIESLLHALGSMKGVPVCLLLNLVECPLVVLIYYALLIWQGELLQYREQKVLETVTAEAKQ
jgi:ABC-2 type transport system permease protein